VAIVNPTPKQARNLRDLPSGPGPVSSADAMLGEVRAAMDRSMADNAARQSDAQAWMDHAAAAPVVSGDRQPTREGHAGHVGAVLGVGAHPAEDLLPAKPRDRLPGMPPAPPPVVVSQARPPLEVGWWHGRPDGPRFVAVSPDLGSEAPAARPGLLARLKQLLKGGTT
jgi:hypothetical protein